MLAGADYSTSETGIDATCDQGDAWRLVGYGTSSTSVADAAAGTLSMTAPSFDNLQGNMFVAVVNAPCGETPTTATLHVIKVVSGGDSEPGDFMLHVMSSGADVTGSPAAGVADPGTAYTLDPGTYVVSEDAVSNYSPAISGDCDPSTRSITLAAGDDMTCTITNTFTPNTGGTETVMIGKFIQTDAGIVHADATNASSAAFNMQASWNDPGGIGTGSGSSSTSTLTASEATPTKRPHPPCSSTPTTRPARPE